MTYSGALRRNQPATDATRPTPLGAGSQPEAHMRLDYAPRGSRPDWQQARTITTPPGLTDDMHAYDQVLPLQAPGERLDGEDPADHTDGQAGSFRSFSGALAAGNAARSRDRGAADVRRRGTFFGRSVDDDRVTELRESDVTNTGPATRRERGLNGLDTNNPDGFRRGVRVFHVETRKFPTKWRRHDARAVTDRSGAALPPVSPAPAAGGGANRYTSPFAWNVASRVRRTSVPQQRRVPGNWDADVVTDGMTDETAYAPSYGSWTVD